MKPLISVFIIVMLIVSCSDENTGPSATGAIKGIVINSLTQEPESGVAITTEPATTSLMSNENGLFEIVGIDAGEYTIYATKNNFSTTSVTVNVKSDETTEVTILINDTLNGKYGNVEGVILDSETDNPVSGVSISTSPQTTETVTDSEGRYKLEYLLPGDYSLICKKSGYNDKSVKFKIIAGKTTELSFKLTAENTQNKPPDKPVLISPFDGEIIDGNEVVLQWECSDPDGDLLLYDVYLSQSNPPDKIVQRDYQNTSLKILIPEEASMLFWKIVAKDYKSNSVSVSDTYYFITQNSNSINKGMILHYTFDEKNAKDVSGHNNDGVLYNNVEFVNGVFGYAAYLKGNDQQNEDGAYIELPKIDFKKYKEFTIALWVNEELAFQNIGQPYIAGDAYINWGIHSEGWIGIGNYSLPPENEYRAINFSVGAISEWWATVPLWVKFDESLQHRWVHYTLIYKDNKVYGYINGKLIGQKYQQINKISDYAAIGRHWWYFGEKFMTSASLIFSVDDVRVYTRALNSIEIQRLSRFRD